MIAAHNSKCVAFDNVSRISGWLSDALCRISSGAAFATRQLHTDDEEVFLVAQSPVIITTISDDVLRRSDLLDRTLIIELHPFIHEDRLSDQEFRRRFELAQPLILGVMLDGVACALQRQQEVCKTLRPNGRLVDFLIWATAAEPALSLEHGSIASAYLENCEQVHAQALEGDRPIVAPIRGLVAERISEGIEPNFEGTATQLLAELVGRVDEATRKMESWPKSPNTLSGHLHEIAPDLRSEGINLEFPQRKNRQRRIRITSSLH
jgi:hypothetical protein